ncbi:MAG: hypothetical protein M0D55_01595 [Elusimicrobiota bacterium]|nr:MAG: hypothetical protein M0D55_01595 [Elusimicrobiota bacterium]
MKVDSGPLVNVHDETWIWAGSQLAPGAYAANAVPFQYWLRLLRTATRICEIDAGTDE